MRRRVAFLLLFYLLTVLLFASAKVVFMLAYCGEQPFSVGDVLDVVGHGLTLDLSTALYFLIVPFLMAVASLWVRVPKWLVYSYCALVAFVFALAFVADSSLYAFWNFKLDASCLVYLSTPTEAMASVTAGYLVVRMLIVAMLTAAFFWLFSRPGKMLMTVPRPSFFRQRAVGTLCALLLVPAIVVGMRGGLGESTTNIGQVYYSQQQFLNHAAVNPIFSFLASIGKTGDYIEHYDYFDDETLHRLTDGLFCPDSATPADTLLTTQRPNVIIIVMESTGAQFTRVGGHPEIMPHLDSLCREGVFFAECYANSWRTDKGLVSILSGSPAFPVTSLMKIPERSRKLPSIAAALRKEGYSTSFLYGGDINYSNMRSYIIGTGYERLTWKADFDNDSQRTAQWGVRDDLMFDALFSEIQGETAAPWMKTLLTLSSHEPWDVPHHALDDEVYNAFHYLDSSLWNLIERLRRLPLWQHLLVVIVPDHGYRYRGINETTRLYNHIPLLWTGGAVKAPRTVEALCNQSDLAATLLGQMGIDHGDFTFSRDVCSSSYRLPMAWHTFNNGYTLIDSTGFVAYDLDAQAVIASEGSCTDSLLQQGRALLQLTSDVLLGH